MASAEVIPFFLIQHLEGAAGRCFGGEHIVRVADPVSPGVDGVEILRDSLPRKTERALAWRRAWRSKLRSHSPAPLPSHPLGSLTSRRASASSEANASRRVSTPSTQRRTAACPDLRALLASLTPPPGGPVLNPKTQGFCSRPRSSPLRDGLASRRPRETLQRSVHRAPRLPVLRFGISLEAPLAVGAAVPSRSVFALPFPFPFPFPLPLQDSLPFPFVPSNMVR